MESTIRESTAQIRLLLDHVNKLRGTNTVLSQAISRAGVTIVTPPIEDLNIFLPIVSDYEAAAAKPLKHEELDEVSAIGIHHGEAGFYALQSENSQLRAEINRLKKSNKDLQSDDKAKDVLSAELEFTKEELGKISREYVSLMAKQNFFALLFPEHFSATSGPILNFIPEGASESTPLMPIIGSANASTAPPMLERSQSTLDRVHHELEDYIDIFEQKLGTAHPALDHPKASLDNFSHNLDDAAVAIAVPADSQLAAPLHTENIDIQGHHTSLRNLSRSEGHSRRGHRTSHSRIGKENSVPASAPQFNPTEGARNSPEAEDV